MFFLSAFVVLWLIVAVVLGIAWWCLQHLVRSIGPQFLRAHLPGLSFIINPCWELHVASFECGAGCVQWRAGKLCLSLGGFRTTLTLRRREGGESSAGKRSEPGNFEDQGEEGEEHALLRSLSLAK